jgi:hypothetical protein
MKQITVSGGDPDVFNLGRDEDGLWLHCAWARPGCTWNPVGEFVFRFRKSES